MQNISGSHSKYGRKSYFVGFKTDHSKSEPNFCFVNLTGFWMFNSFEYRTGRCLVSFRHKCLLVEIFSIFFRSNSSYVVTKHFLQTRFWAGGLFYTFFIGSVASIIVKRIGCMRIVLVARALQAIQTLKPFNLKLFCVLFSFCLFWTLVLWYVR